MITLKSCIPLLKRFLTTRARSGSQVAHPPVRREKIFLQAAKRNAGRPGEQVRNELPWIGQSGPIDIFRLITGRGAVPAQGAATELIGPDLS